MHKPALPLELCETLELQRIERRAINNPQAWRITLTRVHSDRTTYQKSFEAVLPYQFDTVELTYGLWHFLRNPTIIAQIPCQRIGTTPVELHQLLETIHFNIPRRPSPFDDGSFPPQFTIQDTSASPTIHASLFILVGNMASAVPPHFTQGISCPIVELHHKYTIEELLDLRQTLPVVICNISNLSSDILSCKSSLLISPQTTSADRSPSWHNPPPNDCHQQVYV